MNYTVEKVSLVKTGTSLSRCTVLVVAGPRSELLGTEVEQIRAYGAQGGNILFMLEPFVKTGLEPLLPEYGVQAEDDIIIDEARHFWADPSAPAVTDYDKHQITRDLPLSFFPGARSLAPTAQRVPGTSAAPLASSSRSSFGETTQERAEFVQGKDIEGPLTLAVAVSRRLEALRMDDDPKDAAGRHKEDKGRKARVVIIGDSDFATNSFFHVMGNGKFFLNAMNYLAAQENLIGVEPRTFDVPRVNMTNRQMKGTFFLVVVFIPALFAIVGMVVWWRQR
jgi:ABC-type uncharacterized transport system involved in gliding motility auxiliary subunit